MLEKNKAMSIAIKILTKLDQMVLVLSEKGVVVSYTQAAHDKFCLEKVKNKSNIQEIFNNYYPNIKDVVKELGLKTKLELIKNINGSKEIIQWHLTKLRDVQDFSQFNVLTGYDVSKLYSSEIKKVFAENQLQSVIDSIAGNHWAKNLKGVYTAYNKALLDTLGLESQSQVIGKTDYELPWADRADDLVANDNVVISKGQSIQFEEKVLTANREQKIFLTTKVPLKDEMGNITGTVGTSVDITGKKNAEKLKLENAEHKNQLKAQAGFTKVASQVAHDIRSPLASLLMIIKSCSEMPEAERIALREAANSIGDIANNLLVKYQKKDFQEDESSQQETILASAVLLQLLTEKKYQYQNLDIKFSHDFSSAGEFAFIKTDPSQFKRMLSNLINNSVDAISKKNGEIEIVLTVSDKFVFLTIEDNGKGMPTAVVKKIINKSPVTQGKENGHGIGLVQVHDTLTKSNSKMFIDSKENRGTKIILKLPKILAPAWIAEEIVLNENDTVIVLDDDKSIHIAWDLRFKPILEQFSNIKIKHFESCKSAIKFVQDLTSAEQEQLYLLTDFELLKQELNGLHVIQKTAIKRSILVTSHYANAIILEKVKKLKTKMLPKQLASDIPITISQAAERTTSKQEKKPADFVLIDDDEAFATNLIAFVFTDKTVDYFKSPQDFREKINDYPKATTIIIDNNFSTSYEKGIDVTKELHEFGFTNLCLLSGEQLEPDDLPDYLRFVRKDKFDEVEF